MYTFKSSVKSCSLGSLYLIDSMHFKEDLDRFKLNVLL